MEWGDIVISIRIFDIFFHKNLMYTVEYDKLSKYTYCITLISYTATNR